MPTYNFDKNTNTRLSKIKNNTGATSNTEVIRQAVALLEMASRVPNTEIHIIYEDGTKKEVLVS